MRKMKKIRLAAMLLSVVLLVIATVSGTLALMLGYTDPVVNEFTVGNVAITLDETNRTYKMVPGKVIDKDPHVTVDTTSEDCYVFVKIEEGFVDASGNVTEKFNEKDFKYFVDYKVDEGWTLLDGTTNVYYRTVISAEQKGESINILGSGSISGTDYKWKPNQVITRPEVTKADMDALTTAGVTPTLTFTAYACQYWDNDKPMDINTAWNTIQQEIK